MEGSLVKNRKTLINGIVIHLPLANGLALKVGKILEHSMTIN
jgi:hypothetical protein